MSIRHEPTACESRERSDVKPGQAFVRELLQRGVAKIYLGARDPVSLQGLFVESSRLIPLALDVTKPLRRCAGALTNIRCARAGRSALRPQ